MTMTDSIKEKFNRWASTLLTHALKRFPERAENFQTDSGIPVERLSLPRADAETHYVNEIGFPGEYPFTRGVQPTMYRGKFWTMRQYAGFGTAEETNHRFKYLLDAGQTGLSTAFDLPTQLGYDADDPLSAGEVGKVGVSISSLEDMETLLAGIPLDKVSTSMTINAPASILLAMYIAVAKKQGVEAHQLRGTIQNDILKEYVARGTYIFPPAPSMRLITDIIGYCQENLPHWNTISISGYHIREAGSTAVQEVAFTLANAIAYVEAAVKTGLPVDDFAKQLSFFFNAHNNFLEEVAKYRAARRLWAKIMKNRFGAKSEKSWKLRFHTQTGGSTLTVQQPTNNVARVTLQALAAVMGGTQSLHTNSLDEALGLPTEATARVALRTQHIIAYESGVADTIDPFAGSYYVENLTDDIEKRATEYIEKIDALGGALSAIEAGFMQKEIQSAAYKFQQDVDRHDRVVVGVNKFTVEEDIHPEILRVNENIQHEQSARLAKLRAKRDNAAVANALAKLKTAAISDENLMPLILNAVEAYATTGEISNALRDIWGEYQPTVLI